MLIASEREWTGGEISSALGLRSIIFLSLYPLNIPELGTTGLTYGPSVTVIVPRVFDLFLATLVT